MAVNLVPLFKKIFCRRIFLSFKFNSTAAVNFGFSRKFEDVDVALDDGGDGESEKVTKSTRVHE